MNQNIVYEMGNYLHQIISNAEYIEKNSELSEYGTKIKNSAYSIDALLTDSTVDKPKIQIDKSSNKIVDFSQFSGLNVLIVDDILENIKIMENIFHTLSCNVVSAMSGEEAIEIYKNGFIPDIVSMDMVMPGIDGASTTKELKLLGSKAHFIAISALKNQSHDVVALFDCWLPKPFTIEHITGALSSYKHKSKHILKLEDEVYKIKDIPKIKQNEILNLAKNGAYSELKLLIGSLENSESKDFFITALKTINFNLMIKSIVSS